MTTSGVFALSIPSISVLIREVCLIKEQKICFRFYYDDQKVNQKFYMVELVVTDVGILISFKDEQKEKVSHSISVNDGYNI